MEGEVIDMMKPTDIEKFMEERHYDKIDMYLAVQFAKRIDYESRADERRKCSLLEKAAAKTDDEILTKFWEIRRGTNISKPTEEGTAIELARWIESIAYFKGRCDILKQYTQNMYLEEAYAKGKTEQYEADRSPMNEAYLLAEANGIKKGQADLIGKLTSWEGIGAAAKAYGENITIHGKEASNVCASCRKEATKIVKAAIKKATSAEVATEERCDAPQTSKSSADDLSEASESASENRGLTDSVGGSEQTIPTASSATIKKGEGSPSPRSKDAPVVEGNPSTSKTTATTKPSKKVKR